VLGAGGAAAARAEIEALPELADVRRLTSTLRLRSEPGQAETE
jgi:hypothetical protein